MTDILDTENTVILDAENTAIKEIEDILIKAEWRDGWGLTDEEVRSASVPLFYKDSTPTVASDARIEANGQKHMLYCIYGVSDNDIKYADNKPTHCDVTIAITFYYDDSFLFHEDSNANKYLRKILSSLTENLWGVSIDGGNPVPSTDDRQPYINRRILFAKNNF